MSGIIAEIGVVAVLGCAALAGAGFCALFWRMHCRQARARLDRVEDDCLKTMEKVSEVATASAEANTALRDGVSLLSTRVEELKRGHECFEAAVQEELEKLREEVDTAKAAANIKASTAVMIKQALGERIDALSARVDAVELVAGVREAPKVAGDVLGRMEAGHGRR